MALTVSNALAPALLVLGIGLLLTSSADRRRTSTRTLVLWGYWLLLANYFYFRATKTLVAGSAFVEAASLSLLVLEVVAQLLAQVNYGRATRIYVDRRAEADRHAGWWGASAPLIDVFIPSYNEGLEVVSKTITGALNQDYPNFRVWVLDDGNRDWLRDYCRERGVHYLRRPNNAHYKAGNLNHALQRVRELPGPQPEFFAVLDADFVARPLFLKRTLALMHEPRTALVQTPQEFFNPDPVQYAFGTHYSWPDDMRFLFAVRLRGLDGLGNAACCGTSFLVRASALREIGDFPTESVTEDLLTGVKLGTLGYRCVYLKETLSTGLAAEGLTEHLNQRARWALGLVEVGRSAWSPAVGARWPFSWLIWADFSLKWCFPLLVRNLFLWLPILGWWTDTWLLDAKLSELLLCFLPLLAYRPLLVWLEDGANVPVFSDATNLLSSLAIIRSSLGGLFAPGSRPFKVTDKGTRRDRLTIHGGLAAYFGGIILLNVLGMLLHPEACLKFRVAWAFYDILVCFVALVPCFERSKLRVSERFSTNEAATVLVDGCGTAARVVDLSTTGASFRTAAPLTIGASSALRLEPDTLIYGRVVRQLVAGHFAMAFDRSEETSQALARRLYCSEHYIRPTELWTTTGAWLGFLRWLFNAPSRPARALHPLAATSTESDHPALVSQTPAASK